MDRRQDNSVDSQDASDLSLSADVTRLADESHFAPARVKVCPEVRLLRRLFEGNLDGVIEQRLMQHVDACATCERTFQAICGQDEEFAKFLHHHEPNSTLPELKEAELEKLESFAAAIQPGGADVPVDQITLLTRLGRYEILSTLGQGGFGEVYLAYDPQLQRQVAIKIPRQGHSGSHELFLNEARSLASLRHPSIIAVLDFGVADDGRNFIVMDYIHGQSLAELLKTKRPPIDHAVEIMIEICEAVHHAHQKGLIHRDIKPGNIIMDLDGVARLGDFGLARLSDSPDHQYSDKVGTPAYMSPEQIEADAWETVDERTDIWSLGVTLFELFTGQRPFPAKKREAVFEQIRNHVPPAVSNSNPCATELIDVIVSRCLAKSADERIQSAGELVNLLQIAKSQTHESRGIVPVIPKGMAPFDRHDVDSYVGLVPGARDERGLPQPILFWKNRIEDRDIEHRMRVGVLSGSAGGGKTSFVLAGLIPRLADHVSVFYVNGNEADCLDRFKQQASKVEMRIHSELGLAEVFQTLQARDDTRGQILIVLDHLETALLADPRLQSELILGLKHCDSRLQCLLVIEDDSLPGLQNFLHQNGLATAVADHVMELPSLNRTQTENALRSFGTALGKMGETNLEEANSRRFVARLAAELTDTNGLVRPAEITRMMDVVKDRSWTDIVPEDDEQVTRFLTDYLRDYVAPVVDESKRLEALLRRIYVSDIDDRESAVRHQVTTDASEYVLLNQSLRLIRPVLEWDLETLQVQLKPFASNLVVPVQHWLDDRKKPSIVRRYRRRLAEKSFIWNATPKPQHLPGPIESLLAQRLVTPADLSPGEKRMLRAARRYNLRRTITAATILILTLAGLIAGRRYLDARQFVDQIASAGYEDLPRLIHSQRSQNLFAPGILQIRKNQLKNDLRSQLPFSLALLGHDSKQLSSIAESVPVLNAAEMQAVITILRAEQADLESSEDVKFIARLLAWAKDERNDPECRELRFRAVCLLANVSTNRFEQNENDQWVMISRLEWDKLAEPVMNDYSKYPPEFAQPWVRFLKPAAEELLPICVDILNSKNVQVTTSQRLNLRRALVAFADDDTIVYEELLASLKDADHDWLKQVLDERDLLWEFQSPKRPVENTRPSATDHQSRDQGNGEVTATAK
ncbi:MAG: serine/threonine-protein kinase [Pirellulaceae bacterium]